MGLGWGGSGSDARNSHQGTFWTPSKRSQKLARLKQLTYGWFGSGHSGPKASTKKKRRRKKEKKKRKWKRLWSVGRSRPNHNFLNERMKEGRMEVETRGHARQRRDHSSTSTTLISLTFPHCFCSAQPAIRLLLRTMQNTGRG